MAGKNSRGKLNGTTNNRGISSAFSNGSSELSTKVNGQQSLYTLANNRRTNEASGNEHYQKINGAHGYSQIHSHTFEPARQQCAGNGTLPRTQNGNVASSSSALRRRVDSAMSSQLQDVRKVNGKGKMTEGAKDGGIKPTKSSIIVYVCSTHPFVTSTINSQLASQPFRLESTMAPPDSEWAQKESNAARVMVLDKHSLSNWRTFLSKWTGSGVRAIALLPKESSNISDLLNLIDAGIWGIVIFSARLSQDLAAAIWSVSRGTPWLEDDLQKQYVSHINTRMALIPSPKTPLTDREQQVLNLLLRRQTNRKMKAIIGISERTIRFHVSNILHKLDLANRKALFAIACNEQTLNEEHFENTYDAVVSEYSKPVVPVQLYGQL